MAKLTHLLLSILLGQLGQTQAAHTGRGRLHDYNDLSKRAASVNPAIPTYWT
jgi:hypothetical protein